MTPPNDGFVDLRLNHQDGSNQESFWPSFTDIMTVIVMIFMLAMVILLVRNMELVRQLRATMAAEREAMELARSTGQEKEDLALKLIAAENELSMLRVQQMKLDEQARRQQQQLGDQSEQIARLRAKNEALRLARDQLAAEKLTLGQRLSRSESQRKGLEAERDNLQQELTDTRQQLATTRQQLTSTREQAQRLEQDMNDLQLLQETTRQQLSELSRRYRTQSDALQEALRAERQSSRRLSALKGDFDKLQVEYNKLIRPARSPEGRYLVEVRYSKVNGRPKIEFATGDRPEFVEISRRELERRLSRLKKEKPNGLYVKVIFPADSGLTYNEAWSFTSELHSKYDYYSQDEFVEPAPAPQGPEKERGQPQGSEPRQPQD